MANACPRCGESAPDAERAELGGLCPRCLAADLMKPAPPPEAPPLAPGTSFHGLEILELRGRGGMGLVYKARHAGLDRTVALKVLAPKRADDPGFEKRFEGEARALATLDHPNIVRVTDFGRDAGLCFLIMEYVEGPSLRALLGGGRVEPALALTLVSQICDALAYAHAAGVVHRDIKPENILVTPSGRVKVTDFGLAKRLGPEGNLTDTDAVMGTPYYMAPEQARGGSKVDHRADIYSLGVVFYELLTGELPLGRFAPPSKQASVDAQFDPVVLKSLEKEPERRYQTAVQVKQHVGRIDLDRTGPRWRARPWVLAAVASIVVAFFLRLTSAGDGGWRELAGSASGGGLSGTPGRSVDPDVAVDAKGNPVVAWGEDGEILLKRWDGTSWASLGNASGTPEPSGGVALVLDAAGAPVVAWNEKHGTGSDIHLRKWTSAGWMELGGSATGKGLSIAPSKSVGVALDVDAGGHPTVVWWEDYSAYVRRWDGARWSEAVKLSGDAKPQTRFGLRIGAKGELLVAWSEERPGGRQIRMLTRHGDAGTLEVVAEGSPTCSTARLDLDREGRPALAWWDRVGDRFELNFARNTATGWERAKGERVRSKQNGGDVPTFDMKLDAQGRPVVAWGDASTGSYELCVLGWNGTAWEALGRSAAPGGISANAGSSRHPSLAIDPAGVPVVAWNDETPGNVEIYLRRFAAR